jgi:isocitrate/isopropylmalate dehydrogenase
MGKKRYKIGIVPGDGIGRDVIKAAKIVIEAVQEVSEHFALDFLKMDVGGEAFEKHGHPFPQETFEGIKQTDAVLFGAAGPPHTSKVLHGFKNGFDLYAKVCPVKSLPGICAIREKTDLIIVRENTEGLYGMGGYIDGDRYVSLRQFTKRGMERILKFSFDLALKKNREKVTFTHKAGALPHTDEPMRRMFYEVAKEYPSIEAEDMMIDACAMHMVMKPEKFDIIITENANGDILSDVGAGITGGLGLAYSGNIGDTMAVFEPIHGTAPKYADKDVVNPIAAIMSGKMMFDYLGEVEASLKIEQAVKDVLIEGHVRTYDLGGTSSTTEVAEAIRKKILQNG